MPRHHRPHVCSALQHLRSGVVVTTLVLGACIGIHLLIWAFVQYTDVRWTTAEGAQSELRFAVVDGEPQPATTTLTRSNQPKSEAGVDPNRVPSAADSSMNIAVSLVDAIGVVAFIVLIGLMRQTVDVSAGASVPGVNKLVSSSSWALVLALLGVPLTGFISGFPIPGVFSGYASMTAANASYAAGSLGAIAYFATALVLPLVLVAGLTIVVLRYIQGVEEGVIATSVSDLDNKLAKEISGIKIGANSAPRAVGALNTAIGAAATHDPTDAVDEALGKKRSKDRTISQPSPGEPLGRPI